MEDVRSYNVGASDYSKHEFQVWDLWIDYKLMSFDGDLLKRTLRHKSTDSRAMDKQKIIHIAKERIRQIEEGEWWTYPKINPKYSIADIAKEYNLTYDDAMIVGFILNVSENRKSDYENIIKYASKELEEN